MVKLCANCGGESVGDVCQGCARQAVEVKRSAKVEIAYREPGRAWKRRTVTRARLEKVLEDLADRGAEVMTRDAE